MLKINVNLPNAEDEMVKKVSDIEGWLWDITLVKVSDFKEYIINEKSPIKNKSKLLLSSLPKYIWQAKVSYKNEILFALLFDATDIPQGKVFLQPVYFSSGIEIVFDLFSSYCRRTFISQQNQDAWDISSLHHMYGIYSYYYDQHIPYLQTLDSTYGEARTPLYVKKDIEIAQGIIEDKPGATQLYEPNNNFILDLNEKYIWLINEEGGLIIGVENIINNPGGHVTLNQGKPARIAGELICIDGHWYINSKSGRHSGGYLEEDRKKYLRNALQNRFEIYLAKYIFAIQDGYQ